MALDPLTILAIGGAVKNFFGAFGAKKREQKQQDLDEQAYNDSVQQYMAEQQQTEADRQNKVALFSAFGSAHGLKLPPELLAKLQAPHAPIQPPAYHKAGTPGFGWDLASLAAGSAADIYGSYKAGKTSPADVVRNARAKKMMQGFSLPAPNAPGFGSGVRFGSSTTWGG